VDSGGEARSSISMRSDQERIIHSMR
jgi:hypothetical protein